MKRSFGWVLVFRRDHGVFGGGLREWSAEGTRAEDEATIRATPRPQAKLPARRRRQGHLVLWPTMPLLSATTALRRRRKKRCEPICGMRFRLRERSVGKTSAIEVARSAIWPTNTAATRTRPRKRRKSKTQTGKLSVSGGESRPAAIGDRGRYGHRDPPLAPPTPFAITK